MGPPLEHIFSVQQHLIFEFLTFIYLLHLEIVVKIKYLSTMCSSIVFHIAEALIHLALLYRVMDAMNVIGFRGNPFLTYS